jgi:hypothetical protein
VIFLFLTSGISVKAEEFSDNPNLYGTWLMESMQFDGERVNFTHDIGYTQVKYYGKNGEYACVEFYRKKDEKGNTYMEVYPHEYGQPGQGFRFKKGEYTEMGRPTEKGDLVVLDANTVRGRWKTRTDIWKRINLPKALLDHIITSARIHQEVWSPEYQRMMINNLME